MTRLPEVHAGEEAARIFCRRCCCPLRANYVLIVLHCGRERDVQSVEVATRPHTAAESDLVSECKTLLFSLFFSLQLA